METLGVYKHAIFPDFGSCSVCGNLGADSLHKSDLGQVALYRRIMFYNYPG